MLKSEAIKWYTCSMHDIHYDWECICELCVCRNEFSVMASLLMNLILLYICSWMKTLNYFRFSGSADVTELTHCPFHVKHYFMMLPDNVFGGLCKFALQKSWNLKNLELLDCETCMADYKAITLYAVFKIISIPRFCI